MSEKRKPEIKIVALDRGNKWKIEMYPASLWGSVNRSYRVRINGKWHGGDKLVFVSLSYTLAQLRKRLVH